MDLEAFLSEVRQHVAANDQRELLAEVRFWLSVNAAGSDLGWAA